jgi:hypothetical protein
MATLDDGLRHCGVRLVCGADSGSRAKCEAPCAEDRLIRYRMYPFADN